VAAGNAGFCARTVRVAEILGAHGVSGLVRVAVYAERAQTLETLEGLRLGTDGELVTLALKHPVKGGWVARIEGVSSREAAQALAGRTLTVPRESLGETDETDVFYLADLVGLEVRNRAGNHVGTVRAVFDYGAGDLLELMLDEGVKNFGKSLLIPFDRAYVTEVDTAAGHVTVDLDRWLEEQA